MIEEKVKVNGRKLIIKMIGNFYIVKDVVEKVAMKHMNANSLGKRLKVLKETLLKRKIKPKFVMINLQMITFQVQLNLLVIVMVINMLLLFQNVHLLPHGMILGF